MVSPNIVLIHCHDLGTYASCYGAAVDTPNIDALADGIGRICESIDEAGLTEDTPVVFTTEHGLAMPRAKGTCFDAGIEGARLQRQSGVLESGRAVDDLVSNVDVFATLLEVAGASMPDPDRLVGRSLAPLLRDGESSYESRDRVFAGIPGTTATTRSGRSARSAGSTAGTSGTYPRST